MSFDVDKNNQEELWSFQQKKQKTNSKPLSEQKHKFTRITENKPEILTTEEKEKRKRRNIIIGIIGCAIIIFLSTTPWTIKIFNNWMQEQEAKKHASETPVIQNNTYVTAFCTMIPYPKNVSYVSYETQSYVKPYWLTIHVNGTAEKNDYHIPAQMAFNVFEGLGTVKFIEDDTGNEYTFVN